MIESESQKRDVIAVMAARLWAADIVRTVNRVSVYPHVVDAVTEAMEIYSEATRQVLSERRGGDEVVEVTGGLAAETRRDAAVWKNGDADLNGVQ